MSLTKTLQQIYDESPADTLTGSEIIELTQGGVTVAQLLSVIKTFIYNPASTTQTGTVTQGTWNSKIKKRVRTVASNASVTINIDAEDAIAITAQAAPLTIANPTGTKDDFREIEYSVKDNGVSQTINFGTDFNFSTDLLAPTNTSAGKGLYLRFRYNDATGKFDCIIKLDNL